MSSKTKQPQYRISRVNPGGMYTVEQKKRKWYWWFNKIWWFEPEGWYPYYLQHEIIRPTVVEFSTLEGAKQFITKLTNEWMRTRPTSTQYWYPPFFDDEPDESVPNDN